MRRHALLQLTVVLGLLAAIPMAHADGPWKASEAAAQAALQALDAAPPDWQAVEAAFAEAPAVVFVDGGSPKAVEVMGQAWTEADGVLQAGGSNDIYQRMMGRSSVGEGDCYVKARIAVEKLANSSACFSLGGHSYFGFAGGHGKVFLTGPFFNNASGLPIGEPKDFLQDGAAFDFRFIRLGDEIRVAIDDKIAYRQKPALGALGPVGFTPVRSITKISSFEARGDLQPYKAPTFPGRVVDNIVLDPRVKELKGLPFGPFVRLADGGILGVDKRDAIVSHDEGKTWERRPIFAPDQKMEIRPERALLRTRSGAIVLMFLNNAVINYSWDKERNLPKPDMFLPTYSIRSLDEGKTWTDLTQVYDGWCGCIQDMIQTESGRLVVPGQELDFEKGRHITIPYVSDDEGKTWQKKRILDIGGQGDHAGIVEGTLEQLRDGRIWIIMRTPLGSFYETFSADNGETWSDQAPSIKSTSAPGKLVRLQSGRLCLVWNPLPSEGYKTREEIVISFSEDEGQTWSEPQVFATNKGSRLSYPHVFEVAPGKLWVTTMQGLFRAELLEEDFIN